MGNERLRSQLAGAGFTLDDAADKVGVDPKTIERWITSGRIPHPRNRVALAVALGCEEGYLWPNLGDRGESTDEEFVCLYPHRGAVPTGLWPSLIRQASDSIDILVYAGLFLWDGWPDLPNMLASKMDAGTRVRLLFGDPGSQAVRVRGEEEAYDVGSRIKMALHSVTQSRRSHELQIRLHSTNLYNSIFRFDDDLLVNPQVYGAAAVQSPVLQIRRLPGGRLFSHYMESFERVWDAGIPHRARMAGGRDAAR